MTHDSRRYHRPRHPKKVRWFNMNQASGHPTVVNPFGTLPGNIAGTEWRQQMQPWLTAMGLGDPRNPRTGATQAALARGTGPEASALNFLQGYLPGLPAQFQQIGSDAAARGSAAFTGLQGQVDQFLQQLPGWQADVAQGIGGAQQGLGYAQQAAQQAFDPASMTPLYKESAARMLDVMRPGEAARGLQDQGAASGAEQDALSNLSYQFAQNQQGNQQQAIAGLTGATQGLLGAAGAGAQMGQAGMSPEMLMLTQAIPGLQQLQGAGALAPMQAIQQYLSLLGFGQQGAGNLLGQTAPQVGQIQSSSGFGIL